MEGIRRSKLVFAGGHEGPEAVPISDLKRVREPVSPVEIRRTGQSQQPVVRASPYSGRCTCTARRKARKSAENQPEDLQIVATARNGGEQECKSESTAPTATESQ
jgi:hypothetical protein